MISHTYILLLFISISSVVVAVDRKTTLVYDAVVGTSFKVRDSDNNRIISMASMSRGDHVDVVLGISSFEASHGEHRRVELYRGVGDDGDVSDAHPDVTVITNVSENTFAEALSSCDVNGDGIADIVISSLSMDATFVVFGRQSWPNQINVEDLDGTNGFEIVDSSMFTACTDVDGDGIQDLVFSSKFSHSFVIFGRKRFPAVLNRKDLNGTNGFNIVSGSQLLYSVSVGNVSGSVVLIAVQHFRNETLPRIVLMPKMTVWPDVVDVDEVTDAVCVYDVHSCDTMVIGDVNHDGYDDMVMTSSLSSSLIIFGVDQFSSFNMSGSNDDDTVQSSRYTVIHDVHGASLDVASVNDVNSDGVDDIVMNSYSSSSGHIVHVLYGSEIDYKRSTNIYEHDGYDVVMPDNGCHGNARFIVPDGHTSHVLTLAVSRDDVSCVNVQGVYILPRISVHHNDNDSDDNSRLWVVIGCLSVAGAALVGFVVSSRRSRRQYDAL